MSNDLAFYGELLSEIKNRIRQAQIKAVLSVNAEMILLYWDVGRMIHARASNRKGGVQELFHAWHGIFVTNCPN